MIREPIYDVRDRTDFGPQRNGESTFHFFNRVAGSYWEQSRALHQAWADDVGDPHYADVRAALRSDDSQARSVFLELFLHQSLLGAGCRVAIHPDVPHSAHRPDFVAVNEGASVYVEAIVPGISRSRRARASREAALLASLDQVGDPNFLLMITRIQQSANSAPGASFRNQIRDWLATLDPDLVHPHDLPTLALVRDDWRVTVKAIPVRASSRSKIARSIGVYAHADAEFVDDGSKIRAALKTKTSRYGDLDAPFVVAIGMHSFGDDDGAVHNTLYGSTAWVVDDSGTNNELTTRAIRRRDGYFGVPSAWRNRRVSGILIVNQLSLHDPTRAQVTLWLHPDPLHALPERSMFPGSVKEWDGEKVVERPGRSSNREILGLPESWPLGDPWR